MIASLPKGPRGKAIIAGTSALIVVAIYLLAVGLPKSEFVGTGAPK